MTDQTSVNLGQAFFLPVSIARALCQTFTTKSFLKVGHWRKQFVVGHKPVYEIDPWVEVQIP